MRRIIIANTYFQVITAIQLQCTLFKGDEVDLLISNHSRGAEQIVERLNMLNVFHQVCFVESWGDEIVPPLVKFKDAFDIALCSSNRYKYYLKDLKNIHYDEVVLFNCGVSLLGLFSILSNENPDIVVSRMEEGILNYDSPIDLFRGKRNLINVLRRLKAKPLLSHRLKNFYCFYPDAYAGELLPTRIPFIPAKSHASKIIMTAFGVTDDVMTEFDTKYIFFSSMLDVEGGSPIGEFNALQQFAHQVGIENITVKTHPRDKRTIYQEAGFNVASTSNVPWEAIQLAGDFSNKIIVTTLSGSVLSSCLSEIDSYKVYFLYPLCDIAKNALAVVAVDRLESLIRKFETYNCFENIYLVNDIHAIS